jgi:transposase protein of IS630 family insertion sequence
MTINGKELHVWAAHKTVSGRRSSAIASPLKKDFHHRKADEEKRREFLYAPHGQKCAGVSGWSKTQTNVIGALCGTVPFAFTAFDCSIDSDVFHTWATEILLPELPACSVIVMDNAPFHKRQDTLDALKAEGHTVLWLPSYSPVFSPLGVFYSATINPGY